MFESQVLIDFLAILKTRTLTEEEYKELVETIKPLGKVDATVEIMKNIIQNEGK